MIERLVVCLQSADVADHPGTIRLLSNAYRVFGHPTDDRVLLCARRKVCKDANLDAAKILTINVLRWRLEGFL